MGVDKPGRLRYSSSMDKNQTPAQPYRPGGKITGTCLQGYTAALRGADIARVLGPPQGGDGYKVTVQWAVTERATGQVFTVYDWKNGEEPDADQPFVYNVGGSGNASRFIAWLNANARPERIECTPGYGCRASTHKFGCPATGN